MERHKNLSVIPLNASALSPRTAILSSQTEGLTSPLSSQKFNRGRICNLDDVCSTCQQSGHGAQTCPADVLRIPSGNANQTSQEPNTFDSQYRSDSRCESKSVPTFVNPPHHTAQAAIRLQQKKDRRNIWQRWELQSPRYLAYRRKARSKKPGSKEDVWSDEVEEAFQIAIRLYAKRGRTKDELNGRQAGGNEFISDWIEKQTSHRRCRKQISSHIQTLKGFLGDVPAWMDLVTAWPPGKQDKTKVIKQSSNVYYDDVDFVSPSSVGSMRSLHHRGSPNARPPPAAILGSNTAQDPTIRGVQFDMHLSIETTNAKTHIYTSIQSEIGSATRTLEHVPNWQAMFPQLASYYGKGRIDCPLFCFESRLRLIDDIRLGLSLGIEFVIDFAEGAYFQEWRSLTRVHKQGITPQYFDDSEFEQTRDPVGYSESSSGSGDIQLTIPFKSKWWVKLFSSIISRRDGARNAKDREALRWAEEYPSAYLQELSIMQELWATPRSGSAKRPQRMAILLWTFSQTRHGEAATTTWRPLTLSASVSPYQVQEPIIPGIQPSMNLDSALQKSMVAPTPQPTDYYHQEPPNEGGLFTETSEALLASHISECNTQSTTPLLDYRSFPSSASASFPSSISNASGYPIHHGSSFDSPGSRSYSQSLESSFHSQQDHTVVYGMPDPSTAGARSGLKPQEAYDTQDLLYPSQPGSVYGSINEYPSYDQSNNTDDTIVVNDSSQSDFTQGALHLSYATGDTHFPSTAQGECYETPLIAPRANLLTHGQLEQSLQSFETWVHPPSAPGLCLPNHSQSQEQRQHRQQEQLQQQNEISADDQAEDDDDDEEEVCDNGQLSVLHHPNDEVSPHGCSGVAVSTKVAGEEQEGREGEGEEEDEERQRQQQLQYLHDAQDHWQQNFHSSAWAQGLQLPALEGEMAGVGSGAVMDLREEGVEGMPLPPPPPPPPPAMTAISSNASTATAVAQGDGQVLGEIRERIQGMKGWRGWDAR